MGHCVELSLLSKRYVRIHKRKNHVAHVPSETAHKNLAFTFLYEWSALVWAISEEQYVALAATRSLSLLDRPGFSHLRGLVTQVRSSA